MQRKLVAKRLRTRRRAQPPVAGVAPDAFARDREKVRLLIEELTALAAIRP